MIYEHGRWMVPLRNTEEHKNVMQAIYANLLRKHSKFAPLQSSRFFTTPTGDGDEAWIYLDGYPSMQAYKQCEKNLLEDQEAVELRGRWEKLIRPGSFHVEVWSEFNRELWIVE